MNATLDRSAADMPCRPGRHTLRGVLRRSLGPTMLVVAALTVAAPQPTSAQQHFPDDAAIQVMLDHLVADGGIPGIAFGIIEADGTARMLTAGTGITPRSVFEIGSVNKTFTGALLAVMVASGDVALEDPVAAYLPDSVRVPSRNGREITLLDLATHTSGLPRLPTNHIPADMADPYADYTVEKLYAFLSSHELRRDPGAEYEYSNLGYGLLSHALAQAAGMPFTELLRERVLGPLGMDMTGYALEGEIAAEMVDGHNANGDVVAHWFTTEAIQGAGGLRSNLEDMLAYLRANMGEPTSALERALRDAHETHRPAGEGAGEVGLAWMTRVYEGRRIISHNGATGGFNTSMAFAPDLGVGYVMLASRNPSDDLGMDMLVLGPAIDDPVVDIAANVLDRYIGAYGTPAQPVTVQRETDGTLTLRTPGNVPFRMYGDSDTSFYLKRVPWRVAFADAADGAASALALTIDGTTRSLSRLTGDEPPPPEVLDLPVTPSDVARYEGTYMLAIGDRVLELRIFGQDGRLVSQATGQSIAALRHQGDHTFVPDFDDTARLVFTVIDDRATRVTLHQGGAVITGERQP